jgi:hypothetical protein
VLTGGVGQGKHETALGARTSPNTISLCLTFAKQVATRNGMAVHGNVRSTVHFGAQIFPMHGEILWQPC